MNVRLRQVAVAKGKASQGAKFPRRRRLEFLTAALGALLLLGEADGERCAEELLRLADDVLNFRSNRGLVAGRRQAHLQRGPEQRQFLQLAVDSAFQRGLKNAGRPIRE